MTADAQDVHFVVFAIEGQRHAIELSRVSRVLPAVEVTPLAGAPAAIAGVVNVHGSLVGVVDMRARLGLPARPVEIGDHFLLVRAQGGPLLLMTDAVRDVLPLSGALVKSAATVAGEFVTAVLRVESGVLFVDDVDRLLTPSEAAQLAAALSGGAEVSA